MKRKTPQEIKTVTLPLSIPVYSYLLDHHLDGKVILPAVEILKHLAVSVLSYVPSVNVRFISNASFDRFLLIEAGASSIIAANELIFHEDGLVSSKLITEGKLKGGIRRTKEHASICFPGVGSPITEMQTDIVTALEGNCFQISAQRLYSELVPFGPAFHTIKDTVTFSENGAVARLRAPDYSGALEPLGSPFPFDGALHAACAWCQRFCGIVAFPVGFDERVIVKPIVPGEVTICRMVPTSVHKGVIRFDIWLHDQEGILREMAKGVAMRDVAGGRMTPPAWVRSKSGIKMECVN